ncbi:MAG: hypothetical protein HGA26_03905, partial [Chlorobiaceae bacterium]|nr:hypothetical protein [Chlorobiaceae bacterium]
MSTQKKDIGSPDKYDIFIQKIDHFQSLVEEKKKLQTKIAETQKAYQEKIKPLEDELNVIIKKLETNLAKLEGATPQEKTPSKFGRGQLGSAIKNLLRTHPNKSFKPRDIGDA